MKVVLMNKNTEVLVAEYLEDAKFFTKILEIKNIDYAPLLVKKVYESEKEETNKVLSEWFQGRGIPEGRDKLDILLHRLNITSPSVLLDKAYGLSLSDQYWVKPHEEKITYQEINFFDNDFNDLEFTEATFSQSNLNSSKITFQTPNNTTDGVLKKSWVIKKGIRYLIKGGLKNEVIEPFNEVLATMICERLGFHHVPYQIDIIKNNIVSKCPCFITTNTELIPAYQILKNEPINNPYETYLQILNSHHIKNAKEKLDNMFILDYLMLNEDRHLNNFGVIRDVNTLEWIDIAPIFDTGNSLKILDYTEDEIIMEGNGRFFYDMDNFDNIIKKITNLKRIKINKLNGLVEEYDKLLHNYQYITRMSDRKIELLCIILNKQINKLKSLIEKEK